MTTKVLFGTAVLAMGSMFLETNAAELVQDGKPVAAIYHPPLKCEPYQRTYDPKFNIERTLQKLDRETLEIQMLANAVDDLNYHIRKMTGTALSVAVADTPEQIKGTGVVLGRLAEEKGCALPDDPSPEAYRIKIDRQNILIAGRSNMALSHAIYALLRMAGCEWVMPGEDGEIIPQKETLSFAPGEWQGAPGFAYRRFWYGGFVRDQKAIFEFAFWKQRMGLNLHYRPDFQTGGHIWGAMIKKYRAEFEKDPSMYAMVQQPDGSMARRGPQVETTHPRVIELAADYIRDIYKQNGWSNGRKVCIPMGPADGGAISESPESIAAGARRNSPDSGKADGTDHIILFLNQVLEKTKTEFPNLHLGFFLYSWHADYPMKYLPDPRIAINVADINFSRFHGTGDTSSRSRVYYKTILEQWGKLHRQQGNVIEYRPYSWNLADGYLPYTKLKIWGDDIPFMKKMGADSFLLNAYNDWAVNGPHTYLAARMAWSPELKWQDVLKEYCIHAYGTAAAPLMEKYHLAWVERQSKAGQEAGSIYAYTLIYDRAFLRRMRQLARQALDAGGNEGEKFRVELAMLPLGHLEKYMDFRDALESYDFVKAANIYGSIPDDIKAANARNIHAVGPQGLVFLCRFFQNFVAKSVEYSTGKYSIVYQLPERMKTAIDRDAYGQHLNYFGADINDENYLETSTYRSTFDAQGLGLYRTGAVWYRTRFKLTSPKLQKDAGYGLFIGGADNTVHVWCNGRYVGQNGPAGLCAPRVFDLTDTLEPDKENLLAIQVTRFGNYELGTGGIMLPCFVFQGPRIASEKQQRPFRVLPGGVIEYIDDSKK